MRMRTPAIYGIIRRRNLSLRNCNDVLTSRANFAEAPARKKKKGIIQRKIKPADIVIAILVRSFLSGP
jgi:hypothetical protein